MGKKIGNSRTQPGPAATEPSEQNSYTVGYGKPPESTRFKKGKSGNPDGRPKRKPLSMPDTFTKVFSAYLKVTLDGKEQSMDGIETGLWRLKNQVAAGDLKALRPVLDYSLKYNIATGSAQANTQLQGLFDALRAGPVE